MLKAKKITDSIYWVGAIDWNMRTFHGYATGRGTSYNAYLILDDKITLIDTVKEPFKEELLERIASVIDPSSIDYIISSHVEPDHSGSLPFLAAHCPKATIYTSAPQGRKGLLNRYGVLKYEGVKAGDVLKIGKHTLQFLPVPMLHWPDSMVTYCPEEKILFSNDAFGQHLATTERFDDENDLPTVLFEAKKYYANILMLYGLQAKKAMKALSPFAIDMILTGHGVSWRKNIPLILNCYEKWASHEVEDRAVIVYDSMWGSTETIAKTIADAFAQKMPVGLYDLKKNELSDIVTDVLTSRYLAVGSPTINNQMMPTVAAFLCYLKGLAPKNHKAFAFGSFGWGGQSVQLVETELHAIGCEICLGKIRIQDKPTQEQLDAIAQQIALL